ncbi:MAG: class I SAM-dependent rRNA methyltransferase [Candidatus Kapaibacterium sp.]|jgi:23S rRNA (cytosine1962-C5)-methyltransferase
MSETIYPEITLRKNEERRLTSGHLWAFSNELLTIPKDIAAGAVVRLVREKGGAFALGFYNPHSLISARIISRELHDTIDEAFFEKKILEAADRRRQLLGKRNAVRLIHGESDLLPGLILDQYNDILSFQISSVGFETRKEMIIGIFDRVFKPRAIVEKNLSSTRKLEGLEPVNAIVRGTDSQTEIHDEAGTRYTIDVLTGQKTGFFLDQMENRTTLRNYVSTGDSALDLFTNEGGFAINLARAGAKNVIAVDVSASALEKVKANAELNKVTKSVNTVEADCFDYLRNSQTMFDLVVLDPPALAKSKKDLTNARKAYLTLNQTAMERVRHDGILFTASCSHHLTREMFIDLLQEAARKCRRPVTILEERGAGIDHPVLLGMPETHYLKAFILRIH